MLEMSEIARYCLKQQQQQQQQQQQPIKGCVYAFKQTTTNKYR